MPPKVRRINSVPLLCSLCEKNPQFSDVSHLLTHISSKGHLHSRFKLQIRSQTELEAKWQLDNYDLWYRSYGLDALLSERLAAKELKQAAKERKNRVSNVADPVSENALSHAAHGMALVNLKVSQVKKEEERQNESTLNTTPIYRAPIPRMHLWPTTGSRTYSTPAADDWVGNSIYETPSAMRRLPHFPLETPAINMLDPEYLSLRLYLLTAANRLDRLRTPLMNRNKNNESGREKIADSATKLKGVLWPGMNLFDSATPEMKRMRNQRKDINVLEQMMATSADVEPSEIMEKEPSPKKRKARKPTFSDVSVNAPRSKPLRGKAAAPKRPEKRTRPALVQDQAPRGAPQPKMAPETNPLSTMAFGRGIASTLEEDEEFKMTIGSTSKKRSFGIFREGTDDSPESLFGEHRFDFPNHGLHIYPANTAPSRHVTPTPVSKSSMDIYGKENSKPEFHPGLRPQRPTPSSSSASLVFPSQVLHDATSNPLYNEALARSFVYGDYHSSFTKSMKPSRSTSSFNGDFRPLHTVTHADELQDQATSSKNGSISRKNMRYGM
ncbi:uncharacterized protein BP5553_00040 [Venustampulla echinocandica]|uniref:Uncharacterized protein n=1 Tax=Venustampulla echinocandica TaxID=2656787 RepID=A0A370TX11_9HELO|nr:uncharacterized protein BP5553_00040 [Venustampulla echinocandica]RDL40061.1 hypothetical protein BP5553_00040 [Venustampulla echinocandica]